MTTDGRDRMTQNYKVGTLYPMPTLTIIVANRLPPTLHIGCRNILFNARDNVCFYIIICLFFAVAHRVISHTLIKHLKAIIACTAHTDKISAFTFVTIISDVYFAHCTRSVILTALLNHN